MNFQRVNKLLFPTLKVFLWGCFIYAIFESLRKLFDKQLGFTTTTEKNGFEMTSMSFCAIPIVPFVGPKSFEDLDTNFPKVKGQKLLNATIMKREFYSEDGAL